MMSRGVRRDRSWRRLVLVIVWLAVIDLLVPGTLSRLEYARYETGPSFRFANSDLFALGPLISYLREHPSGERPRTVFFGNSMIFGYRLSEAAAVPARYQALVASEKVFNFGINDLAMGGSYLIAKALIGSIDTLFVLRSGTDADKLRLAADLIPMTDEDIQAFGMPVPNRVEQRLRATAERWHLYAGAYRLQAALFGASTRHFVRSAIGGLSRAGAEGIPSDTVWRVEVSSPWPSTLPSEERALELRQRHELLWRFAELIATNGKRGVFLQVPGYSEPMSESDAADFNAVFGSDVEVAIVRIPPALLFDGIHVNATGARVLAEALLTVRTRRPERTP